MHTHWRLPIIICTSLGLTKSFRRCFCAETQFHYRVGWHRRAHLQDFKSCHLSRCQHPKQHLDIYFVFLEMFINSKNIIDHQLAASRLKMVELYHPVHDWIPKQSSNNNVIRDKYYLTKYFILFGCSAPRCLVRKILGLGKYRWWPLMYILLFLPNDPWNICFNSWFIFVGKKLSAQRTLYSVDCVWWMDKAIQSLHINEAHRTECKLQQYWIE